MPLINWVVLFICFCSAYFSMSDRAVDVFLAFLQAIFQAHKELLLTIFSALTYVFPSSVQVKKRHLNLQDKDTKYVVYRKCDYLYKFKDSFENRLGKIISKRCINVAFPHRSKPFSRTRCDTELLKEIQMKDGKTKLYPYKVYCHKSVRETLISFIKRLGFVSKCESWRSRKVPEGCLFDIYDGQVWKEWENFDDVLFLGKPNNYAFMLNVDWFQPFTHSIYSVGVIYLVLLNLPRNERFKEENINIVRIIPGPHEPKLTIKSFLQTLVAELNILWSQGIRVKPHGCKTMYFFRADLICVVCDIPALRKVCGFTGCNSHRGCSKCKKYFLGSVQTGIDFSGFDNEETPRTDEEHHRYAQSILNASSSEQRAKLVLSSGTLYYKLLQLPYFDCVRYHVIDPMHNLFLGTVKHIMKNIWLGVKTLSFQKRIYNIYKKRLTLSSTFLLRTFGLEDHSILRRFYR